MFRKFLFPFLIEEARKIAKKYVIFSHLVQYAPNYREGNQLPDRCDHLQSLALEVE